jgi:prevent-host-death family protein
MTLRHVDIQSLGTAEAKRRFSELVDRVGEGERFLVSRRGRPAVALVPPAAELLGGPTRPPAGLATVAGALADWDGIDAITAEIYAARRGSRDRPAPELD